LSRLIPITDPADPRIAAFRDIRERDLVGREGRFVAEGRVVLNVLVTSKHCEIEAVLLLENRVAGLTELLAAIPPDVPVYVADATTMDAIAGFHIHRGILAIGRRPPPRPVSDLLATLPSEALVVALAGIANHDNIGSIFRNVAAFGADAVVLDPTCCNPFYRKAIRVSVGAVLRTPFAVGDSLDKMVTELAEANFRILALSPGGQSTIGDVGPGGRVALLLGSEGHGLPPALMARLETVRIPIADDFDSLNVAAASAVALHRLGRG